MSTISAKIGAAAGALGLALMTQPAVADDLSQNAGEAVTVSSEPIHYSTIGAPIQTVSISRAVPRSDLDLRTDAGAKALRARVQTAARDACALMDDAYPVAATDSPDCYQSAVHSGMAGADAAIREAREVAQN